MAPWSGVLADRPDKRRRLIRAQVLTVLMAVVLCVLTLSGAITVWMVLALTFVRGLSKTITSTSSRTFQIEVAGEENVQRGTALSGIIWQTTAVGGIFVAGLLIAAAGIGTALVVVVLCMSGVVLTLGSIDLTRLHIGSPTRASTAGCAWPSGRSSGCPCSGSR